MKSIEKPATMKSSYIGNESLDKRPGAYSISINEGDTLGAQPGK